MIQISIMKLVDSDKCLEESRVEYPTYGRYLVGTMPRVASDPAAPPPGSDSTIPGTRTADQSAVGRYLGTVCRYLQYQLVPSLR